MATDAASAAATDPTNGKVLRNAALMQAYRLREVAFRFALDVAGVTIANPDEALCSRARDFAACVKAWTDTNVQARIANGTPLPGSLRPERKPSKRKQTRTAIAPIAHASTSVEQPPQPSSNAPSVAGPPTDPQPTR